MLMRQKIEPAIERIIAELAEADYEAYVVGGAVRDLLLDLTPKDYDIATSALPEEVREVFGRRRSRIIGRRFRLVHVYTRRGVAEVSTFRREPTPEERRERAGDDGVILWRDNEYGSLDQDAHRRDFTVNALYFDPVGDKGIIDLVGGVDDLEAGLVRAIGDPNVRLDEDPVRMLRALKLAGQYGFRLEQQLAAGLEARAQRITLASKARLLEELLKILARPSAYDIFAACRKHGMLRHYWPALDEIWDQPDGDVTRQLFLERRRRMTTGGYSNSRALALATACAPGVATALGCAETRDLCVTREGVERECRDAVRDFFRPFPVSRFFTARVRDIILMLPRLANASRRGRVMRHPDYMYGRELFSLLVAVCGLDGAPLDYWPPAAPTRSRRGGGSRRPRPNPGQRATDRRQPPP